MRVLHTSDWHIGRRFKGIDLLEYQRKALEWLIGLIKREQVDVLCVSGDVYDAPRPSAGAVRLFNEMFQRLGLMEVNGHPLHIIFTPGNHDSAARLGFAAALMLPNVHMRCDIADIATPIMVDSADGEQLAIYALPYLDPDLARPALQGLLNSADVLSSSAKVSDSAESDKRRETSTIRRSHEGVIRAALQLITADLAARRKANPKLNAMLMAHAFVSGATASDSERNITVGGVDSVPAELFSNSGLDYLALGHLHRPQKITIPTKPTTESQFHLDRTPQARYSGSLLAYSFSESQTPPVEGNGKSVWCYLTSRTAILPNRASCLWNPVSRHSCKSKAPWTMSSVRSPNNTETCGCRLRCKCRNCRTARTRKSTVPTRTLWKRISIIRNERNRKKAGKWPI